VAVLEVQTPTPAPFPRDIILVLLGGMIVLIGLVALRIILGQRG
jgi:hypothetical protein